MAPKPRAVEREPNPNRRRCSRFPVHRSMRMKACDQFQRHRHQRREKVARRYKQELLDWSRAKCVTLEVRRVNLLDGRERVDCDSYLLREQRGRIAVWTPRVALLKVYCPADHVKCYDVFQVMRELEAIWGLV